jgi:hypothetical protein
MVLRELQGLMEQVVLLVQQELVGRAVVMGHQVRQGQVEVQVPLVLVVHQEQVELMGQVEHQE